MAHAPARRKTHRTSLRLSADEVATIDRAARLRGCSRAAFVRAAALRAAEETLRERGLVRMCAAGFGAFVAAIAQPATAVPAMVDVLRRTAPWDTRSK